ncbi:MAG: D-alanine--D-alanine ligase [Desulfobulbus propionicus]|nr:MAG: D-alanine--D-alanine ligase [Desulfobulbus propionicus]
MGKIRLALIAGGKSDEREVSLNGAAGVEKELDKEKYDVVRYDPATDLEKIARDAEHIDAAFVLLHGLFGEDGTIQGFLDLLDIPYQCAGVLGSALAMNKNLAKVLYRREQRKLSEALQLAFKHDDEVMVEEFIQGREITVGVIGNDELMPLPLIEIIPDSRFEFFDYEAKYVAGASEEICPAEVSEAIKKKAQNYACTAHKCLQLGGYSRTDMIVRDDDEIFVLETNTIPGMTPTSLLPQAAAEAGLPFPVLLDRLIELAMEGRNKQ